jgi:hypothetical protein
MLGASEQAADAFRVSSGLAISQLPRFMANSQTLFTSSTIPFAHIFKYSINTLTLFRSDAYISCDPISDAYLGRHVLRAK